MIFRPKRRIRIHFKPETGMDPSLEGILVRRGFRFLVIDAAELVTGRDIVGVDEPRHTLSRTVVPLASVLIWEVL